MDGKPLKYDIWDTSGQGMGDGPAHSTGNRCNPGFVLCFRPERFRSFTPMYYRDAEVALLVFDVSSRVDATLRPHNAAC
jgi:GTPase SAR1 family protein